MLVSWLTSTSGPPVYMAELFEGKTPSVADGALLLQIENEKVFLCLVLSQ